MKQVIVIREDLGMSRGKSVAQGAHVSVLASREASEDAMDEWLDGGGKKITLSVDSEDALEALYDAVEDLPKAKIRDLGHTELEPNTLTACAIGPAPEADVDEYTGHLPLYK